MMSSGREVCLLTQEGYLPQEKRQMDSSSHGEKTKKELQILHMRVAMYSEHVAKITYATES